jgi:hypothetical protein
MKLIWNALQSFGQREEKEPGNKKAESQLNRACDATQRATPR